MTLLVGSNTTTGFTTQSQYTSSLIWYQGYTATTSGTATALFLYAWDDGNAADAKLVIWNSSGVVLGASSAIIASGGGGAATWYTATIPSTTITAGQTYYLGFCADAYVGAQDNGSGTGYVHTPNSYPTVNAVVPGSDGRNQALLMYADGTTSGTTLTASNGTFSFTGEAATLVSGKTLVASNASFSLVGEIANLNGPQSGILVAAPGVFGFSGGTGSQNYTLISTTGFFGLAGFNAGLGLPAILSDNFASFSLSGVAAAFQTGLAVTMSASSGSFSLNGAPSNAESLLDADLANYVLVGEPVLLLLPPTFLYADCGMFSLIGENAILVQRNPSPAPVCTKNLEIIIYAYQKIGVIDENSVPSNEQGIVGLSVLNDYLLNESNDGLRIGWFKQTDLQACTPIRDEDLYGVKLLLAMALAAHYGITPPMQLIGDAMEAKRQLIKRSIRYFESDFSEFPRSQGGPWSGPNWI